MQFSNIGDLKLSYELRFEPLQLYYNDCQYDQIVQIENV